MLYNNHAGAGLTHMSLLYSTPPTHHFRGGLLGWGYALNTTERMTGCSPTLAGGTGTGMVIDMHMLKLRSMDARHANSASSSCA